MPKPSHPKQPPKPPARVNRKPDKIIAFDNQHIYKKSNRSCGIFKLYSPFSKRNYLYIDPALADEVYATDKLAFKDLESMCDVGHVLGSSKGRRGFILKGNAIKGKNCSKDYRFYGSVKRVKELNGKVYTLFCIDSWSQP